MIKTLSALVALLLLAGCAGDESAVSSQFETQTGAASMAASAPVAVIQDYRISPLDKLSVNVFQLKELSATNVQVDASGRITLPLIGQMAAGGKTATELSLDISKRLAACCLQNPQVTVAVDDSVSRQITVTGAVKDPGVFTLKGPTHLVQALSMAKGFDMQTANTKKVAIFRVTNGQRTAAAFDVSAILNGKGEDPEVFAGDTIIVDSSGTKSAWHNVLQALPLATLFAIF